MVADLKVKSLEAIEILDSRGYPTVSCRCRLSDGSSAAAAVPSGASTGQYEAHELRDKGARYNGKGVSTAVENINRIISPEIIAAQTTCQSKIDSLMLKLDGTDNKSLLGANAILAVSLAVAKASAKAYKLPLYRYLGGINAMLLPVPMMNILNGGAHASNNIDIQEFMIMPVGAQSFSEGLRIGSEIYHSLGNILKKRGMNATVGDEGGFAPSLETDEQAIELILEAISSAGYTTDEVKLALDAATSEWQDKDNYLLPKRKTKASTEELISYWEKLVSRYPIISIEDALSENDFEGWTRLTSRLGNKIQLVGDDLFVTNPHRLSRGIKCHAGNSILVKVNQIGTLTEALDAIRMARSSGYTTVISHRSGETEDTTIADLAVACNAGQIKTGAPCRSERTAKYNRLLEIEHEMHCHVYGFR